jgi:hypothetical protein
MDHSGTPIRFPSTANLYIDSLDRSTGTSTDFTITKQQNILAGFFTRIGVVEIVVDWCIDNISAYNKNNTFTVNVEGDTGPFTVTVPDGSYTVAVLLDALVFALNDLSPSAVFSIGGGPVINGFRSLDSDTNFTISVGPMQTQLNLKAGVAGVSFPVNCPNLLTTPYIDFVCSNLTYQQGLKDASTNNHSRDVLYRWVFAWDGPAPSDYYGYPIYQGYERFVSRRYLSFPKQIKWNGDQPIGQLSFQVYDNNGLLVIAGDDAGEFEWYTTLLISEQ